MVIRCYLRALLVGIGLKLRMSITTGSISLRALLVGLKLVECNARKVGLSALLVGNGLKLRHSASTFRWCLSALCVGMDLKHTL